VSELDELFENNRQWSDKIKSSDPDFFTRLSEQQNPEYLWIGCSDSRVPATQIVDKDPGTIFVHRNIANVVVHTDLNCLSVMQYAVDVLKVKHIIVCGHYGCGGVAASLGDADNGLIDNWLLHIRDVYEKHQAAVDSAESEKERINSLCEFNVNEQVRHVAQTSIVKNAWIGGQNLSVNGLIYSLEDGIVKDLLVSQTGL
jgi:carbonic anhydrase